MTQAFIITTVIIYTLAGVANGIALAASYKETKKVSGSNLVGAILNISIATWGMVILVA